MEICSRFTGMERKNGAFLLHTDNADIKVCFVTDEIVRVRASFDHELAEEPYVLMTTAWEDRIKPLSDVALYRSTRIHHTPDSYTKRELVGARPLHLAYARPFCRLKAPLGLSLLRSTAQTRTCRGGPLHLAYARPFGRLKAPLGLSLLRCAAQTRACRMAGGAGSHLRQRKTGSSRWGTPCCTYRCRMWILAGCVFRGAPCFCFAFNLLARDFLLHSADIPLVRRSESVLHTPEGRCK